MTFVTTRWQKESTPIFSANAIATLFVVSLCFATAYSSNTVDSHCHVDTSKTPCKAFVIGTRHAFARRADGSVVGWGEGASGQLGLGCVSRKSNAAVSPAVVPGASDVVDLAAGLEHTVARRKDGTLLGWGNNYFGQLGLGDLLNRCVPVPIQHHLLRKGFEVVEVVAGSRHTLVRRKDGLVLAWGWNHYGQLGVGTVAAQFQPTMVVKASDVAQLVASGVYSLARRKDGTVLAWGDNSMGQLGLGYRTDERNVTSPAVVEGANNVKHLVAGSFHTLALQDEGSVLAWGDNAYGQLGLGDITPPVTRPFAVPGLSDVVQLVAGGVHSLALTKEGAVLAWGSNFYGQLGLGDKIMETATPTAVPGATDVAQIVAGNRHTILRRKDGTVLAFGDDHDLKLVSALGHITY